MDINLGYWIIEYVKVFLACVFLMYVWPSIVFRKFLSGKSLTVRFGFCTVIQVVIVNTVVLMLGLVHILNRWTMCLVFYGILVWSLRKQLSLTKERRNKIKYLVNGTFGWRHFLLLCRQGLCKVLKKVWLVVWRTYRSRWLEYTLLAVTIIYGAIYFSWGVFHERSYGFSDMYVHHAWIYDLARGKIFSDGIYPEGMHCFIYGLNALFGVRIYSGLLFVSSFNVVIMLLSMYCMMKELFKWRYCAVFGLIVFLIFGGIEGSTVLCMSRIQCTLPQEFGFPAAFLCAAFLIRYLKSCHRMPFTFRGKETKGYWNENLIVFILALAATIIIHFYDTFMAFYLCVGVVIALWRRVFSKERFLPLVVAAGMGLLIAATPMVVGFATGIPLQGSLHWAMGVLGVSVEEQEESEESTNQEVLDSGEESAVNTEQPVQEPTQSPETLQGQGNMQNMQKVEEVPLSEKISALVSRIYERGKEICMLMYYFTFRILYNKDIADIAVLLHCFVLLMSIVGALLQGLIRLIFRIRKPRKIEYAGYFIIIFASLVYILAFTSTEIGLPMLVDRARICAVCLWLTIMIAITPIDLFFQLCNMFIPNVVLEFLSYVVAGAMVIGIYITGYYHGYLYFALTRFDATVQVTNQIINELPKGSFTIISPTEELYQMIEHGYHEELLTFMEKQQEEKYVLPTEYVFLFVEKKPLQYVQLFAFDGPEWLAGDKYERDVYYDMGSTWPVYRTSEISREEAEKDLVYYNLLSDSYSMLKSRTIIEAKAYYWCEKFREVYPNEMKTYYEDEYFVCYYWRQNMHSLYNLVIE